VVMALRPLLKSRRGIMPDPIMKISKPFDASQGCSAAIPL
jgi:hypothetical protein